MSDHRDRVQCPLCAGHGEVHSSRLAEFFSDPQLNRKIEAYVASACAAAEDTGELVAIGESKPTSPSETATAA